MVIIYYYVLIGFWGTTVAIFDFENNGLEPYEVRQLSIRLESELVIVNKYNVIEISKTDEILKNRIQLIGCVEEYDRNCNMEYF